MAKMSSRMSIVAGDAAQLRTYLEQSAEIQEALRAGLQSLEVFRSIEDASKVEVVTRWRNLDALKNFRQSKSTSFAAFNAAARLNGKGLSAVTDSVEVSTTRL